MKSIKMLGMAVLAVFAMAAVAASAASPAERPYWKVAGTKLAAGKTQAITSTDTTTFTLKAGSIITIECASGSSTGELIGGVPGTDTAIITFTSCKVAGRTEAECHVNSPGKAAGSISTEAKTELVYDGTEAQATKHEGPIGDLFSPKTGSTFVELEVSGGKCPTLSEGTNKVEGSIIAEIPSAELNKEATSGKLVFPSTAIGTGYLVNSAGEVTNKVKPSLKVFGFVGCSQVGTAEVKAGGTAFGAFDK